MKSKISKNFRAITAKLHPFSDAPAASVFIRFASVLALLHPDAFFHPKFPRIYNFSTENLVAQKAKIFVTFLFLHVYLDSLSYIKYVFDIYSVYLCLITLCTQRQV